MVAGIIVYIKSVNKRTEDVPSLANISPRLPHHDEARQEIRK